MTKQCGAKLKNVVTNVNLRHVSRKASVIYCLNAWLRKFSYARNLLQGEKREKRIWWWYPKACLSPQTASAHQSSPGCLKKKHLCVHYLKWTIFFWSHILQADRSIYPDPCKKNFPQTFVKSSHWCSRKFHWSIIKHTQLFIDFHSFERTHTSKNQVSKTWKTSSGPRTVGKLYQMPRCRANLRRCRNNWYERISPFVQKYVFLKKPPFLMLQGPSHRKIQKLAR